MKDTAVTYVALRGRQLSLDGRGETVVGVIEGGRMRALPPADPEGRPFEWGHWGPGPLHLAESILLDHLGFQPAGVVALTFSEDVISELADEFELEGREVDRWISEYLVTGCLSLSQPQPAFAGT